MKNNLFILVFVLLCISVKGQEYILFEKQKGINTETVLPNLCLSQNDVVLKNGDTTVQLFNLFYFPDGPLAWKNISPVLKEYTRISNILITAIPIINPGDQLVLKKLTSSELDSLKILTHRELMERSLPDLTVHVMENSATRRRYKIMPSLKTWEYGLIIKEESAYYKVMQKVLVTKYTTDFESIYFPNQFRDGLLVYHDQYLPTATRFLKTYRWKELDKLEKKFRGTPRVYDILDRTYLSNIDTVPGLNQYVFDYWEFPDGDGMVQTIYFAKKLEQYHPGLGSFSFLPRIGIINCTLDYYLKKKILYDQKLTFSIISINSLGLGEFKQAYNKSLPKAPDLWSIEEP